MALATTLLLTWRLSRPALWIDESASVVATQRTWRDVGRLLQGTDAPLVPYYALLKLSTRLMTLVWPGAAAHPEWLFRLPSVAAVALAATVLVAWLARVAPARVALGTGVVLLLAVSTSRYGQEARPYAFMLLGAVLSSVAWAWASRAGRRRPLLVYALAVAAMIAANALTATLLVAHLVAALSVEPGQRSRTALRTVAGGALGVAVALPFTVLATVNGGGRVNIPVVTYETLRKNFTHLFTTDPSPFLGYGFLVVLCLVGATRVVDQQYRFVARLALAWAAVPPILLLPAVIARPSLLITRYLVFTVPGWAILGGLGLATVVDVVRRLIPAPRLATVAAAAVVLGLVAGLTYAQVPSQQQIRTRQGHGVDPRKAIDDLALWPDLPVITQKKAIGLQIATYDRAATPRMVGIRTQWTGRDIWPTVPTLGARRKIYERLPAAIALIEPGTLAPGCQEAPPTNRVAWAQVCLPRQLRNAGFHVQAVRVHGTDFLTEVLGRS